MHAKCPDGHEIKGTNEIVYGVAETKANSWRIDDRGMPAFDYTGYTDIAWELQETTDRFGGIYFCYNGENWNSSDLVLEEGNPEEDEDGLVTGESA